MLHYSTCSGEEEVEARQGRRRVRLPRFTVSRSLGGDREASGVPSVIVKSA